jgi:hypothetical protein
MLAAFEFHTPSPSLRGAVGDAAIQFRHKGHEDHEGFLYKFIFSPFVFFVVKTFYVIPGE